MTSAKFPKSKRQRVTLDLPSDEEKRITSSLLGRLLGSDPANELLGQPVARLDSSPPIEEIKIDQKIEVAQSLSNPAIELPGYSNPVTELPSHTSTQLLSSPAIEKPSQPVTQLRSSREKGYFTPNFVDDEVMPDLQLSEQVLLRRLFRLSYGFNRQMTDAVSIPKLAEKCHLSEAGVKNAIKSLESKGLIKVQRDLSGNPMGGNKYEVLTRLMSSPVIESPGQLITRSVSSHIKHDHDDLNNTNHHQSEVMKIYSSITGNSWNKADQSAYEKIKGISVEQIEQGIKIVAQRAVTRPGSLAYFVKELQSLANPTPATRGQQKATMRSIVEQLRAAKVGGSNYSIADLAGDVKDRCAKEGIVFDAQLFNEILGI